MQQRLRPRSHRARLALDLGAHGDDVRPADLRLELIAGREASRVLLEAEGVHEIEEGVRTHAIAGTRKIRPGVEGVDGEPVLQRVAGAQLVARAAPHVSEMESGHADLALEPRIQVRPSEGGRPRRAHAGVLAAQAEAERRLRPGSESERGGPTVLAEGAVGLLVVGAKVEAPDVPVEASRAAGAARLAPPPAEASPLGLGAPARREGIAGGDEMDHAREGVRAVEAARRAAHDLDPLELERQQGPEVVFAARLVDRDAVDEDAREVGLASAHEERALQAEPSVAGDGDAGHLLEQREHGWRFALCDALSVEDGGAHADGGERGLVARRGHDDVLPYRSRGQGEIERGLGCGDIRFRGAREEEPGGAQGKPVVAGGEAGDAIAAFGAGDDGTGRIRPAHEQDEVGNGSAFRRVHGSGEDARRLGVGPDGRAGQQRGENEDETAHRESPLGGSTCRERWRTDTGDCSSFTREASGSNGSGQVSWLPGHRSSSNLPRLSAEWRRSSAWRRTGSPATVAGPRRFSTCFPFPPRIEGHPDVMTRL